MLVEDSAVYLERHCGKVGNALRMQFRGLKLNLSFRLKLEA